MSRDEVIDNLGTIARSGTAAFLEQLSGDQQKDSQLIGQFGVGFYSSFIVADRVKCTRARRAGEPARACSGSPTASRSSPSRRVTRPNAARTITLHLQGRQRDFADDWRVRSVITKYSDHISVPVMMQDSAAARGDEEDAGLSAAETVRGGQRGHGAVDAQPQRRQRRRVQGVLQACLPRLRRSPDLEPQPRRGQARVHQPAVSCRRAPFDLWNRDAARGLKLYVQRTFIMDDAEEFLPLYLRFVKGVLDSNDLSLNVSREILQKDKTVDSLRSALTKRVLDMLGKLAKKEPEKYATFWKEFGQVLKEGPAEDFA
jgi:molecular chaperone HtpG